ncbi:MAG TPA: hypothetical protein VK590_16360, partial [Saprospiraceae bacterium]|nr:hypothetical protein [Saprospiraceae bacterium]
MKKPIITLILCILSIGIFAQNCGPGGITFSTQLQIDQFSVDYPGCTNITGSVTISGANITNLNGLSQLSSIVGGLYIQANPVLTSLNGLSSVSSVGGSVIISNNSVLSSLTGLGSITSIGSLNINNNASLSSLSGLSSLSSIGGLYIINNSNLS